MSYTYSEQVRLVFLTAFILRTLRNFHQRVNVSVKVLQFGQFLIYLLFYEVVPIKCYVVLKIDNKVTESG